MPHPRSPAASSRSWLHILSLLLAVLSSARAITLNVDDPESIKAAAKTMAHDMMSFYPGNKTGGIPGLFGDPYYWWEAGAAFNALIDYWYLTGDTSYVDVTTEAMLHQVGPENNYMPPNQTSTLGNDDQAFWAMAAMSAAEYKFPNPPSDKPQWLALAQAVFNSQVPRWDDATCGGGLRWQIFSFNTGYTYKNAISNGAFFNLGARLARYTGNQTYADLAERAYDWMQQSNLLHNDTWIVYDGSHDLDKNCTETNKIQWSYNVAILLHGAANMYNFTKGSDKWRLRTDGLLKGTQVFFDQQQTDVMVEAACETVGTCNTDQKSFKAYLSRWMAASTKMAPFTYDTVLTKLKGSAKAAAAQCTGGGGSLCGLKWTTNGVWDGTQGVGEQMSALEVTQGLLVPRETNPGPVTEETGGISEGDNSAGTVSYNTKSGEKVHAPIGTADRAGAGILTAVSVALISGGCWWITTGY